VRGCCAPTGCAPAGSEQVVAHSLLEAWGEEGLDRHLRLLQVRRCAARITDTAPLWLLRCTLAGSCFCSLWVALHPVQQLQLAFMEPVCCQRSSPRCYMRALPQPSQPPSHAVHLCRQGRRAAQGSAA
jgi:hypothetical protein